MVVVLVVVGVFVVVMVVGGVWLGNLVVVVSGLGCSCSGVVAFVVLVVEVSCSCSGFSFSCKGRNLKG